MATVLATVAAIAAIIGVDWVWHSTPGSTPVAAVIGDPRVHLEAELPPTPVRVPIYEVGRAITTTQVRQLLGGTATIRDGWMEWQGHAQTTPQEVMHALNPGISWRTDGIHLGPGGKGIGVTMAGLSSAFTGTDAVSNSFGLYQSNGRYLVRLSIPAHRIRQVDSIKVIPAVVALLDVRHHRSTTQLLPDTVPLLPQRLIGAEIAQISPITDVRLVHAEDPRDSTRSRPVWVFDPVAEADARR